MIGRIPKLGLVLNQSRICGKVNPEQAKAQVLEAYSQTSFNQSRLAEQLGVSRQSLSIWLRGESNPRDPEVWVKMWQFLGMSTSISETLLSEIKTFLLRVLVESESVSTRAEAHRILGLLDED